MKPSFKKKLTGKERLIGTVITLPSAEMIEIFCRAGFDWFFIDLEHSAMSRRDAQLVLQVAGAMIPCLVRVRSNDDVWVKAALDIGASGVIIPQIRTPEDATRAVRFSKYPPEGLRSVGIARAQGYGDIFQEAVASANDDTAVILQIEHIDAVENIERILEVSGIDGLFVGPYDLSASMGKIGHTTDPDVQGAISKVKNAAGKAGMPLGIFGATPEALHAYMEDGFTLLAAGIDTMLIGKAATTMMTAFGR